MGAGGSKLPLPDITIVKHDLSLDEGFASSPSIARVDWEGQHNLVVAYVSSPEREHGHPRQHIRVGISIDGGLSWSHSIAAQWGLCPLWAPVLHWDERSHRLFLFYSESRKSASPGGDVKLMTSQDCGKSWSEPRLILAHEAQGGVPKVTANALVVGSDETWYLPVHFEPYNSQDVFTWPAKAKSATTEIFLPDHAPPQSFITSAGVLASPDGGDSWRLGGVIEDVKHWVIQPALCRVGARKLLALMRTDAGWVFCSRSEDGGTTWSRSTATSIPNPNAKIAALQWGTEDKILLVHHTAQNKSSPLALSLSDDQGYSFSKLVEMELAEGATEPSMALWAANTVKVMYAVAGTLRLATLNLSQGAGA